MSKRLLCTLIGILCLLVLTVPGQKRLKVIVLYDMEGVVPVLTNVEGTDFDSRPDYEPARQSLTARRERGHCGTHGGRSDGDHHCRRARVGE